MTAVLALVGAPSALAAGPVVAVGTPYEAGEVSVGVDSAGDAVVAWSNTKDLSGSNNFVQYCILPVGAVSCEFSGNLVPADHAAYIDNVQVLVDGATDIILADVYGATGGSGGEYEPEQEWQSTNGGATWVAQASGKSVSDGIINADTEPNNGLIVPGTGELGYGWQTAGGPPTFNAFPLASPPECSTTSCASGYATLEPSSNPDQVSNSGGQFASELSPTPGVLGVFNLPLDTSGPLACPDDGFAYVYGSGAQSASNNYNISPGDANSAWKVPVTLGDCDFDDPAVAGGPSGLGVLETDLATNTTVYHRFDQSAMSFATTTPTEISSVGEQQPSLSQDGVGGIYAVFLNGGYGGTADLAYSSNGGATWTGPNSLVSDAAAQINDLTNSVNSAGQGWMAWFDGIAGTVDVKSFTAADAVPPAQPTTLTTTQTSGTVSGASIGIPAGTVGETDRATITGANSALAGGSVSYALYSSASCSAATMIASSTEAVTGGSAAASAPITAALAPGTYYWQASYSGDSANLPSASACGTEVLTVSATGGPVQLGGATSNGATLTISVTCGSPPCTFTITITDPSGEQAQIARKKAKKHKPPTLASGRFTIRKRGSAKVTLRLSKAGKSYIASHHGTVKLSAALTETVAGHTKHLTKTIRVKISRPKPKHRK